MEKRNKINKMKGECTKKQAKVLRFYKFSVTLPEPNRRPCADGEAYVLCTRTGSSVERVESGSSISIMETRRLSEFTPYSGVDSSFMFLHYRVLPEPYSREMWMGSPHRFSIRPKHATGHEETDYQNHQKTIALL